jgi:hypothetical protein
MICTFERKEQKRIRKIVKEYKEKGIKKWKIFYYQH